MFSWVLFIERDGEGEGWLKFDNLLSGENCYTVIFVLRYGNLDFLDFI